MKFLYTFVLAALVLLTVQSTQAETHDVSIAGFAFNPAELVIQVGDVVHWTNNDGAPHTATSDDGTTFDSGTLSNGQTFEFMFESEGSYPYFCQIHPAMTATITVEDTVASAAEGSAIGLANSIELHAAYPNPFNPTTTLVFDNPRAQQVQLAVYDLLGRRVALLQDATLSAGRYEFTFDAAELATGLYFARVQAVDVTQTRKITLIK